MSSEQVSDFNKLETPKNVEIEKPCRVDINHLIARVRREQKKETKVNIVFFGLILSVFLTVGVILSL